MNHQLSTIIADFEAQRARVQQLTRTVPAEKWPTRSDPLKWSVAECIEHLNITSRVYIPLLQNALAAAPALSGAAASSASPYSRDIMGRVIGFAAGPMPRIFGFRFGRTATKPTFVPAGALDMHAVVDAFNILQDEQIALVKLADGKALNDVTIVSPFESSVKYNAYSCFVLLPRHQLRHVEQAERVWR